MINDSYNIYDILLVALFLLLVLTHHVSRLIPTDLELPLNQASRLLDESDFQDVVTNALDLFGMLAAYCFVLQSLGRNLMLG